MGMGASLCPHVHMGQYKAHNFGSLQMFVGMLPGIQYALFLAEIIIIIGLYTGPIYYMGSIWSRWQDAKYNNHA